MRHLLNSNDPDNIYLFKLNNRNTRERCEMWSKLATRTKDRRRRKSNEDFIFHTLAFPNYKHLSTYDLRLREIIIHIKNFTDIVWPCFSLACLKVYSFCFSLFLHLNLKYGYLHFFFVIFSLHDNDRLQILPLSLREFKRIS